MMFLIFVCIILIALIAYWKNALTKGATLTSIVIATGILLGFKLFGFILLGAFFVSSTLIGRIQPRYRFQDESDMVAKGQRRDSFQVIANGLWPSVMAILFYITSLELWYYSFIASIAAATSDTWASEIGKHSRKRPVHIFSFRPIATGQSGGVSLLGTVSAFIGSYSIIMIAFMLQYVQEVPRLTLSIGIALGLIGFLGQFVDTVFGATIQRLNRCISCNKITEKAFHCGKKTEIIKGVPWITNDVVNHFCSLSAIFFTYLYVSFINI